MLDLKVADLLVVAVRAVAPGLLVHDRRRHRPVVVELDLERGASTVDVGVVIVLLHELRVVDADAARLRQEAARARHIVDEARVAFVPADHAQRGDARQRQVDHALGLAADAALADGVQLAVGLAVEAGGVGLVGDDADRARLGRCAVERALRPRQALDPRDVVDVDVEVAADRRHRLLVEIHADRGQRARVVAVAAARDAAHVDDVGARIAAERLEGDRRQLLDVALEVADVEVLQLLRAERLDADRHVLQVLSALLRGHDDDVIAARLSRHRRGRGRRVLRVRRCRAQRARREQHGGGGAAVISNHRSAPSAPAARLLHRSEASSARRSARSIGAGL